MSYTISVPPERAQYTAYGGADGDSIEIRKITNG